MISKSAENIIEDVRVFMDEAASNEAEFLSTTDQQELDSLIWSQIPDAYRAIHLSADSLLLTPTVEERKETSDGMGVVCVDVPRNILRVLGVTLSGWNRYVSEFIRGTDILYAELKNPITTGTMDNPKAAVLDKDSDNYRLELYSYNKEAEATIVLHTIPEWGYNVSSEEDAEEAKYQISKKVYSAMICYTAGLVYKVYKDSHADVLIGQALQMIGAKI